MCGGGGIVCGYVCLCVCGWGSDVGSVRVHLCVFVDSLLFGYTQVDSKVQDKTALHVATNRGNLEMVRLLLDYKASVNIQDEDGDRPLHLCAFSSEPEIAELLIQHGANPNLKNHRGATAVLIAAAKGNVRVVKQLLKARDVDLDIPVSAHCY